LLIKFRTLFSSRYYSQEGRETAKNVIDHAVTSFGFVVNSLFSSSLSKLKNGIRPFCVTKIPLGPILALMMNFSSPSLRSTRLDDRMFHGITCNRRLNFDIWNGEGAVIRDATL
jgi:hypothetical protein